MKYSNEPGTNKVVNKPILVFLIAVVKDKV